MTQRGPVSLYLLFQQALCIKPVSVLFVSNRCHFMVFNASVLYFQKVRPLLQPGWFRFLVPSLKVVVQSLEEVDDKDHSWRAELMMWVTPEVFCHSSVPNLSILLYHFWKPSQESFSQDFMTASQLTSCILVLLWHLDTDCFLLVEGRKNPSSSNGRDGNELKWRLRVSTI